MPQVQRLLVDTDGIRLTDTDGAYLALPGEFAEAVPLAPPSVVRYDETANRLEWDPVANALSYVVFETREERGVREVLATTEAPQTHFDLAEGVGPDEHPSWRVAAYDDYVDMTGSPSRPAFFAGDHRK